MLNIKWWERYNNFLKIYAIARTFFFFTDNKNGTSFYTRNSCWICEWIRRVEQFLNCRFRCEKLQFHRQITWNYSNDRRVSNAKRVSRMQFHVENWLANFATQQIIATTLMAEYAKRKLDSASHRDFGTLTLSSSVVFFARPHSPCPLRFSTSLSETMIRLSFPRKRKETLSPLPLFVSSYNFSIKSIGHCYFAWWTRDKIRSML